MFFQGSLQDGIALAVQQSRLVVCFVTDDGDESQLWENEFLTDGSLKSLLENQAVILRLTAGSEEAGFLEALFPVPRKPTVVIIQNGQLKEYLHAGTVKEDFIRRVETILRPAVRRSQPVAPQAPAASTNHDLDDLYDDYDVPTERPQQAQQRTPDVQPTSADKKAKEAKAKAEREAQAKKRRESSENNESRPASLNSPERTYAEEVRQRKIQAAEERKRILKRIEDDRLERREREAEEKQARLLLSAATQEGEASSSPTLPINLPRRQGPPGTSRGGGHCNLQVRLFDGSTIRSRFKTDSTLAGDVRKWIDEERTDTDDRGNAAPYTFRVVLTPLPNRAIKPAEESESLLSLGLAPSATLVLVPSRYSSAYAHVSGGLVWRGLSYILGIFGAGYGLLADVLGGITGMLFGRGGAAARSAGEEIPLRNLEAERAASRIRGFRNAEDERRDAQLYNGNSLNFEPRRDDDDDSGGNN